MCDSTVASTSRFMPEDSWERLYQSQSFPVSDLRDVDFNPPRRRAPPSIPLKSQHLAPSERSHCSYTSNSKFSTKVVIRKQIEQGVWSDGTDRVLSASCPDVQAFLSCARDGMMMPAASSEVIFCLAALEVFYKIEDPVHWMFWSDEKKLQTAEVVDRIALHRPQRILSPVSWNGSREYLFILSGLHGATSAPLFESKWWYTILNPSKVPSPPRVPNLRKRKPQQIYMRDALSDLLDEPEGDVEEPPLKRARPSRSSSSSQNTKNSNAYSASAKRDLPSPSPAMTSTTLPIDDECLPTTPEITDNPQDIIGTSEAVQEKTLFKKRKPPQASPPLVSDSQGSRGSSPPSLLLTPSNPHARNRSTSQASSQTLVASPNRRSVSVLSAITAVEMMSEKKDNALAGNRDQSTTDPEDEQEMDEASSGMVTRGRASKARTNAVKMATSTKKPSRRRATAKQRRL